ncbi:hypothetical protein AAH994_13780 [Weeksellaceae bacterium A-14]
MLKNDLDQESKDQNKNIIRFFERIVQDEHLLPSHISMYVSLFQFWSLAHYKNPFRISREAIMESSKIRSLATYHKCIKELHHAGFIIYTPSYDPYRGSLVEMIDTKHIERTSNKTYRGKKLQERKESCFSAPNFFDVELYFNERDQLSEEATRFYSFYESRNWSLYNSRSMTSWEAAARNWISDLNRSHHNPIN